MSAYAALISLKNTIYYILHSSRISLVHPPRKNALHHVYFSCCLGHNLVPSSWQIIKIAYKQLQPWERILERLDKTSKSKSRKKLNALDGRIKETLWNFEDLLESLLSHQIILQSSDEGEKDHVLLFSIDLQRLQDDVDSFIRKLKDLKKEYIHEVDNMPQDADEDEDEDESACIISSSTATFVESKSKMIGLCDQFDYLKIFLPSKSDEEWVTRCAVGLIGMAGIGKTGLAREIYEDPKIMTHFDCRLWIRVGRKSSSRENHILKFKGDEKRCLIVLDDLWEKTRELSSLLTSIKGMKNTYVRILFIARSKKIFNYVHGILYDVRPLFVRFLKEEESKKLLCHKVFGENIICPPQLDKAATKIAKV